MKVDKGVVDKQKVIRKRELYDEVTEEEIVEEENEKTLPDEARGFAPPTEEEFDEDHALDMVMNDMVSDLSPKDISKIVEESEKESEPNEELKEAAEDLKKKVDETVVVGGVELKKDTKRRGVDIDGDGTIDGYDNSGDGLIDEPVPSSSMRAKYVAATKPYYARPDFNWGDRSKWINNQNAVNYWLTYIKNEKDTNYPTDFDSKTY